MRLDVRIRKVGETKNTDRFELLGESPPMKAFYANTEVVSSLPFDTEEMVLSISTRAFADGEVALAFPPVPFFWARERTVRYQHTAERKVKSRRKGRRKDWPAPNTPDTPVNLAYVNRVVLPDEFVADQEPIFLALSPVTKDVAEGEEKDTGDIDVGDEIDRADALAKFRLFLTDSVRQEMGSRLTARRAFAAWARLQGVDWNVNSDPIVIGGVHLNDVSSQARAVVGHSSEGPTRIDGRSQRYWSGYTI